MVNVNLKRDLYVSGFVAFRKNRHIEMKVLESASPNGIV